MQIRSTLILMLIMCELIREGSCDPAAQTVTTHSKYGTIMHMAHFTSTACMYHCSLAYDNTHPHSAFACRESQQCRSPRAICFLTRLTFHRASLPHCTLPYGV